MIPRYSRPEMAALWSDAAKFGLWQQIEVAVAEVQADLGMIPAEAAAEIRDRAGFDLERIQVLEAELKHDVIAFLTSMGERIGPSARFLHQGLTSSDVVDTGFALQLRQAADLLLAGLDRLLAALHRRALEHRDTLCIGRTHGIHGEATSFGLKLLGHYAGFRRARARLEAARAEVAVAALSGAVGTYSTVPPAVEAAVLQRLGLGREAVSTQVIPRDRHAAFFACLGVIAAQLESLATEIRHLQRTEVREAEEFFDSGQKGSSAMPHKRNPVLTENLCGLARVVRGMVVPALENVALWHERDISHSSAERMIAPDATVTLDFMLHRMAGVMERLLVYPDQMRRNLEMLRGLPFSQTVMLALTQAGMSREEAYRRVQAAAMEIWARRHAEPDLSFAGELWADGAIRAAFGGDEAGFLGLFDWGRFVAEVPEIFARVLGEGYH